MLIFQPDLHQFSSHLQPIDLSFHQYLLNCSEPLLVHTGNQNQATAMLPQLKALLAGKKLAYIFISHFEADECGGLPLVLQHYPEATPVCSEVTARQLAGFGIANDMIIKQPGEKLISDDYELEFISYPSEMHLWDGLLLMETRRKIFFSSDLMLQFGEAGGKIIKSNWQEEVNQITPEQIPDPDKRAALQKTLSKLSPAFVATGHGPCLKLT